MKYGYMITTQSAKLKDICIKDEMKNKNADNMQSSLNHFYLKTKTNTMYVVERNKLLLRI